MRSLVVGGFNSIDCSVAVRGRAAGRGGCFRHHITALRSNLQHGAFFTRPLWCSWPRTSCSNWTALTGMATPFSPSSKEPMDADDQRDGLPLLIEWHVQDFTDLAVERIIDILFVPRRDRHDVARGLTRIYAAALMSDEINCGVRA